MRSARLLAIATLGAAMSCAAAEKEAPPLSASGTKAFRVAVGFSVKDTTEVFECPLGRALRIQVTRESPLGWVVSVTRKSGPTDQPNLLYHSRTWHGPYPTDVYPWSRQCRMFPDERFLPVYGHPHEIRVRLIDCRTSGTGDDAVFEAGTVEVAWRNAKVEPMEQGRR